MNKHLSVFSDPVFRRRLLMSVAGVLICGLSVGLFKRAAFGVDPFQSMMSGLDAVIPIPFGTLYMIVCAVFLIFSLVFDRSKIGIATFINLFLLGYVAEFSLGLLTKLFPAPSVLLRAVFLVLGIVIMCFSASLYFTADLGVSVYDAIALILSEKQSRIPFRVLRIMADFICVLIGVLLCLAAGFSWQKIFASVGIGTIITAFFMGPLIDLFCRRIAQPFLDKARMD
ncbi:MAG: hypothetical protein IJL53_08130 [Firmicutes bacterium]|nr:hypothetical protein [Bacillota bacterium]